MIANTNPNYDMIYAGHEKLPANIVWLAINCCDILLILALRIKKKEYTLTIGLPLLIFFPRRAGRREGKKCICVHR